MTDYDFSAARVPLHVVIFTGGDFPHPELTCRYWKRRAVDYVIAADSGFDTAQKYIEYFSRGDAIDFSPDVILGDFDSIANKNALLSYGSIVETFDSAKDFTDTELAFFRAYELATEQGREPFITLVGGSGGRIDHTLLLYDSFASACHAHVWLTPQQAVYFLAAGKTARVTGLATRDVLSVARTTESRRSGALFSHGLRWEHFRSSGMRSISNCISNECDKREFDGRGEATVYAGAALCKAEKIAVPQDAHGTHAVSLTAHDAPFLLIVPLNAEVSIN
ncbi:MAG: thiamine pyrophosphokinase [Treponema sp.]|nr:thiamine pyrophosphokinase [Treponema sp.]